MSHDILEHYGTKGMKWGVRKAKAYRKSKSAKQTAKTLTNKELKKRVDRLNMEKQYAKMSETSVSKGRTLVVNMLKTAGKQKAQSLITSAVSTGVDRLLKPRAGS